MIQQVLLGRPGLTQNASEYQVSWTNRGTNTVAISAAGITLNMQCTSAGLDAANAYSQTIDFSAFVPGKTLTVDFQRVYSGGWWDDNFVNASFITVIAFNKDGNSVALSPAQWTYLSPGGNHSSYNSPCVLIEWRRTYDLPPKVRLLGPDGQTAFSDIATQVNPGSAAENGTCAVRVAVTRPAPDAMKVDIYISDVLRWTASGSTVLLAGATFGSGCFFAHGHTYSNASTVAVNGAVVKIT